MRRKTKTGILLILMAVCCASMLTACGKSGKSDTKVILTTGFAEDEIFRIEGESCKIPEVMVYLTNTQNQYEQVYGRQIWEKDFSGATLEEKVKEAVLAKIAQIKSMNLLAEQYQVELTGEEQTLAATAAKQYFESLNASERDGMGVTQEEIGAMYAEYALAQKVYDYMIKDINPEISDDEARTITIQHILIKTWSLNGNGERVPFTEAAKADAYRRAQEVLAKVKDAGDFALLASEYNEDSKTTYSFGKGEMEESFETAAFNLGTGEVSGIVETQNGYHIIKCVSTFSREETDANKIKIVEQRKKEVFSEQYDSFVASLNRNLNASLWKQIAFLHDEEITTSDFFAIYDQVIGENI